MRRGYGTAPKFCARLSVPLALAIVVGSSVPHAISAQDPGPSSRRVVALREATLKNGVRGADFERYFADSVAGPMNRHIPGLRAYLMKGERGARVGAYVIVYEGRSDASFRLPYRRACRVPSGHGHYGCHRKLVLVHAATP